MSTKQAAAVLAVDGISISFTSQGSGAQKIKRTVVDNVSFKLSPGRVLALVGESGSGKTVTAMSILGLLPGSASVTGSIRLNGEELLGAHVDRMREVRGGQIGTIFQEPMNAFNPVFTIGYQIAEALGAHHGKLSRTQTRNRVAELLASVGIRDAPRVSRSYPHELSGGQLQRAMIAMAISCDPVAIIADEPTTALDVTVQAGILDLIRELRDRLGTAVLLITHDMGVVADLADDVVVMHEGVVKERADVSTLFTNPTHDYTKALLEAVPKLGELKIPALTTTERVQAGETARIIESEPAVRDEEVAAQVEHASIVYGGEGWGRRGLKAVDDVSFHILPRQMFGLVGESGSGKSTIGRALVGLIPVSEGAVRVAGLDMTKASKRGLREIRRRIGYVFQDPASSLNPRFTIGQSVAEPLRLHSQLSPSQLRDRVAELLDAVQLSAGMVNRFQHELSGGQRQRVAIARAIALNPALLIADEPTSALDVSVQAKVLDLLRDLQNEYGFACLFISHDLAVVQQVVDEVAVMLNGRIVERGSTEQVLSSPTDAYTQRLLAAAPVADPERQRARREAWRRLAA